MFEKLLLEIWQTSGWEGLFAISGYFIAISEYFFFTNRLKISDKLYNNEIKIYKSREDEIRKNSEKRVILMKDQLEEYKKEWNQERKEIMEYSNRREDIMTETLKDTVKNMVILTERLKTMEYIITKNNGGG